jgi:hypothetical protein
VQGTIWKFSFGIADEFLISLPDGARFLHLDVHNDMPCLWFAVDPEHTRRQYPFHVRGTGRPLPDGYPEHVSHLGTLLARAFVYHVFGPSDLL